MKLFIIVLFSQLFSSCTANITCRNIANANVADTQLNGIKKAEQLKRAYQKVSSSPYTIKYQQEYFAAFPNTFNLFNHLFGYSDKDPLGEPVSDFNSPLYNKAYLYVEAFFKLTVIPKNQYYNRMIDISINGRWYADGVGYFQHAMQEKLKSDTSVFLELLAKRSDKEIKSFWYFYFDGPHPVKELPDELQKLRGTVNRIFLLMELALKEVQQAWKE
ncbi:MAG: hypothetical protein K1X81_03435 [Bacteroidia bacterium]|nr:hypothetical protein [Bacteroidia bacterium]